MRKLEILGLVLTALVITFAFPAHAVRTLINIEGAPFTCDREFGRGLAEIQIDNRMQSEAGAAPGAGVLVVNLKMINKLSPVVQRWILSHECGHLVYKNGGTELQADTYGIKLGIRQGWLTPDSFKAICDSWEDAPAVGEHPSGRTRCKNLKNRYAQLKASNTPPVIAPSPPPTPPEFKPEPPAWRAWSLLAQWGLI